MQIDQFELQIHALILEQGKAYFNEGAVLELSKTSEGWRAVVLGQHEYHVLIIGHFDILDWNCDCPYDHGPVCKHIAATFYAIQDREEHQKGLKTKALDILNKAGSEELKAFLRGKLDSDAWLNAFLDFFEKH